MMKKVTFITGEVDSGKTTKLIDQFNHQPTLKADGFACIKRHDSPEGSFSGYALRRLSTGETRDFIMLKEYYRNQFEAHFEYTRFVLSQSAMQWGKEVLIDLLTNDNIETLFIDEVGQLEIKGSGYDPILKQLLQSDKQLFMCVSVNNLIPIIRHYAIRDYDVIVAEMVNHQAFLHS